MSLFSIEFCGYMCSDDVKTEMYILGEQFMSNPVNLCSDFTPCVATTSYLISEISKDEYDVLLNEYLKIEEKTDEAVLDLFYNETVSKLAMTFSEIKRLKGYKEKVDSFHHPNIGDLESGKYYLIISVHE